MYVGLRNSRVLALAVVWLCLALVPVAAQDSQPAEATAVPGGEPPTETSTQESLGVADIPREADTARAEIRELIERVKASVVTVAAAERKTLEFLEQWVPKGVSPMCGNSICQDRRFLARLMPTLESFFHYRNLDVSSVKELARRWAPDVYAGFDKDSSHLALDDIRDSIAELRHYREHLLVPPVKPTVEAG